MTRERAQQIFDDQMCENGEGTVLSELVTDAILAAVAEATAEQRRKDAEIAREAEVRHKHCPPGCKCNDGYHIAAAIEREPTNAE